MCMPASLDIPLSTGMSARQTKLRPYCWLRWGNFGRRWPASLVRMTLAFSFPSLTRFSFTSCSSRIAMLFWVNSLTRFAEIFASSVFSRGSHFFRIIFALGSATPMPLILA